MFVRIPSIFWLSKTLFILLKKPMVTVKQEILDSSIITVILLSQFYKLTSKTECEDTDDLVYITVIHMLYLDFFIINKNPGMLDTINRKVHNFLCIWLLDNVTNVQFN